MRDFARPAVLLNAALAALAGTAACLPKMARWTASLEYLVIIAAMLGWCVFVLWGFVFAWSSRHAGVPPFQRPRDGRFWALITLVAIAVGLLLTTTLDAEYRRLFPFEDSRTPGQWTAALFFNLSLQQLFLCFAPIAFFSRLGAPPGVTLGLTVALTLSVLTMKLDRAPLEPSAIAIVGWVAARGLIAAGSVLIYRRGGVLAVWWFALLLQCRHLPRLFLGD
jgi:hypothetical protein